MRSNHIRNQSNTVYHHMNPSTNEQSNRNITNLRIRNVVPTPPRSTQNIEFQSQHRSVSHNGRKQSTGIK